MDSININNLGGANSRGNVQITLRRRCGPDTRGLVGETHVQRVAIHVAVHSHRADAHLFAGPDDSAGNLAAIGDQDFAEGSRAVVHKIEPLAVSSVGPERTAHRSLLTANWSGFRRG